MTFPQTMRLIWIPQASLDLRTYQKLFPTGIIYARQAKRYCRFLSDHIAGFEPRH